MRDITTGEQTVTEAGVVTGTLDTSALVEKDFNAIHIRVTGLAAGKTMLLAIEDTSVASVPETSEPFDDARVVAVLHVVGGFQGHFAESETRSKLACTKFGASNTKLRARVLAITSGGSAKVWAGLA